MNFESSQSRYFLSELNRALPNARSTGDANTIQQALGISDPSMPAGTRQQATDFLNGFSTNAAALQADQQCRALPAPGPAMRPDAGSRVGCGWWYNPTGVSTGAYGSRRGPMSPTLGSQFGTGQWIWDVEQAQELEGLKQAAALPTCADLAYSKVPNIGWCTSTNMGIITDGAGNPMYPRAPGGDCVNGRIITNPQDPECTASPGGSGSSSGPIPNSVASACGAGAQPLNTACLSAISSYSCPTGSIASSYGAGTYPGPNSNIAMISNYITQRNGLALPSGLINDGNVSIEQAFSGMQALKTAANAGDGSKVTMAASNLCYSTPFDPCALNPTDAGPFDPTCIVKAATAMGYANNADLFSSATMGSLTSASQWQQVTNYLTAQKQQADGTASGITPPLQQTALPNVYGVNVQNPKRGCNFTGVQMYRFIGSGLPITFQKSQTHFLGRYLFKNGFPSGSVGFNEATPDGGFQTEFQNFTTVFTPTVGGSYSFVFNADGQYIMGIAPLGQLVTYYSGTQSGGTTTSTPVEMIAYQPYSIQINLLGCTMMNLTYSLIGQELQYMPIPPALLTLPQDHRLPMINFPFYTMAPAGGAKQNVTIADPTYVFQNFYGWNTSIGPLNGKNCLNILGPASGMFNHMQYCQGIRLCAVKSFTMMLNITSVNYASGTTPSILSFWNQPGANGLSPPHPFVDQPPTTYYKRQNDFSITMDNSHIYPFGLDQTNPSLEAALLENIGNGGAFNYTPGTWFHLAFVWDDDFTGYTMYKDGKQAARGFVPAYSPTLIMEQMRIGCDYHPEGQSWTGGIAWCRMFDYRLSTALIQTDMNDAWSTLSS